MKKPRSTRFLSFTDQRGVHGQRRVETSFSRCDARLSAALHQDTDKSSLVGTRRIAFNLSRAVANMTGFLSRNYFITLSPWQPHDVNNPP